eukprot:m.231498 g.231498  ORF g.231498 m.231498 type:complete len:258 (+) comp18381_c0_seq1:99-872(+)
MEAMSMSRSGLTARVGTSSRVDRDGWWKSTLKASPNPGSYATVAWTEKLPECTMVFKASGRDKHFVRSPQPVGAFTQPGLYEPKDSMQELMRKPRTYSFRGLSRDTWGAHMVGHQDKHLNLSPGMYEETSGSRVSQPRSAVFMSSSSRFPTPIEQTHTHTRHIPSANPPPTAYKRESTLGVDRSPSNAASSLGSSTPRFNVPRKAVSAKLGPGYYESPTPLTPRTALSPSMLTPRTPRTARTPRTPARAESAPPGAP